MIERVAVQILASADVDRVIGAVLDHEMTERALDRALASPGSSASSSACWRAGSSTSSPSRSCAAPRWSASSSTSPPARKSLEAVTQHTQTLAEEMVADVRRRTQTVDDVAERTVRGWLRRPPPSPS